MRYQLKRIEASWPEMSELDKWGFTVNVIARCIKAFIRNEILHIAWFFVYAAEIIAMYWLVARIF